ncbi:TrkH family potassium uptake protein [Pelotomaculum isophthalicicum JI]|uniref:TrkH family potassium uptake protein n=1 Tax=Pelotomaculum isophthalicicum JI TaxID=947010 RepID=A0A9X4JUY3_9FIRM|nr:TrkH family potassium uptake protein [Pelotomaculum isophthalicicum]MDF9407166.1 TrkH family potassium uptake protein [Pelotomaculum isophthalicicum JI]
MNKNLIIRTLGLVLICEAGAMLPSFFLSLYYKEPDMLPFLYSILLLAVPGFLLTLIRVRNKDVGYREGFAIATMTWLVTAACGGIPFLLSGTLTTFYDAFFETMSGFTTTGASVIPNVEILPHGILFWRSFTHFLGGMGTIVLILALIPSLKVAAMQLYKAEVPGPTKSKVLPRILQTTRQLWKVYMLITATEVILLVLAGMPLFDSFIHTFGSVGTGGFSCKNASIGAYNSPAIEYIVIFFMSICGMNFALHYSIMRGNFKALLKDPETKLYLGIIAVSTALIALNAFNTLGYTPSEAFRSSFFTVSSIITTTGYVTADFDRWPDFSKIILLLLMFVGGCAGSTGGAIKNVRFLILFKSAARQILKLLHPQAVVPVRLGRQVVPDEVVENVQTFFFLYMLIFGVSTLYITTLGFDLVSAAYAVAATLGNVGPGLGLVGPMTNYAILPDSGKLLLSFCMLVGRLEIYTVLVVFSTRFWR